MSCCKCGIRKYETFKVIFKCKNTKYYLFTEVITDALNISQLKTKKKSDLLHLVILIFFLLECLLLEYIATLYSNDYRRNSSWHNTVVCIS